MLLYIISLWCFIFPIVKGDIMIEYNEEGEAIWKRIYPSCSLYIPYELFVSPHMMCPISPYVIASIKKAKNQCE